MVTKKDLAVAILATFCLTSTLFMIAPTRSQTETPEYDPWTDLNDDGKIDIFDIVRVALAFGSEGTPINKTALLLQMQSQMADLNASVIQLQQSYESLNASYRMRFPGDLNSFVCDASEDLDYLRAVGKTFPQEFAVKSTQENITLSVYYNNSAIDSSVTASGSWSANPTMLERTQDANEGTKTEEGRSHQTSDDVTYIQIDLGTIHELSKLVIELDRVYGNDVSGVEGGQSAVTAKNINARYIRVSVFVEDHRYAVYHTKYSEDGQNWLEVANVAYEIPNYWASNPYVNLWIKEIECFCNEIAIAASANTPAFVSGYFYPMFKLGAKTDSGTSTVVYVWEYTP